MRLLFLLILSFCFWSSLTNADELVLTSGQKVQGKILEQTDKFIKIDPGVGTSVTYYTDEISTVNDQPLNAHPSPTPVPPTKEAVVANDPPIDERQTENIPTPIAEPQAPPETIVPKDPMKAVPSARSAISHQQTGMDSSSGTKTAPSALLVLLFFLLFIFLMALCWFAFCAPYKILAVKTNTPSPWMAWVPILNLYLICKIAEKPGWWMLLCFIPLVNIVVFVLLLMAIAQRRNKPKWLGILGVVPLVNLILPWYLALSDDKL